MDVYEPVISDIKDPNVYLGAKEWTKKWLIKEKKRGFVAKKITEKGFPTGLTLLIARIMIELLLSTEANIQSITYVCIGKRSAKAFLGITRALLYGFNEGDSKEINEFTLTIKETANNKRLYAMDESDFWKSGPQTDIIFFRDECRPKQQQPFNIHQISMLCQRCILFTSELRSDKNADKAWLFCDNIPNYLISDMK
jgi:hypothetical protein